MPATVIAERIGWDRGITILRDRVAELRPLVPAARSVPAHRVQAGRAGPVGSVAPRRSTSRSGSARPTSCWVVTARRGYSRFMAARMIATTGRHDVLGGHLRCLVADRGRAPQTAVYDGEGCIGQWRRGKQVLTDEFQRFRGTLGMGARSVQAQATPKPRAWSSGPTAISRPSFLPGRRFADLDDFNGQLARLAEAGQRAGPRAPSGAVPTERIDEDRAAMMAVPAGAARPGLAPQRPGCPRSLGPRRHQRLLGAPPRRRPPRRGARSTSTGGRAPAATWKSPATGAAWPSTARIARRRPTP